MNYSVQYIDNNAMKIIWISYLRIIPFSYCILLLMYVLFRYCNSICSNVCLIQFLYYFVTQHCFYSLVKIHWLFSFIKYILSIFRTCNYISFFQYQIWCANLPIYFCKRTFAFAEWKGNKSEDVIILFTMTASTLFGVCLSLPLQGKHTLYK